MPDPNITTLRKETYLKAIENSVGTKLFNSLFVQFKDSGKINDAMNDGMYSCAFFVSSVLYILRAIDKPHATVKGLRESLEKNSEWQKVDAKDIRAGDVIFWEKIKFDDSSENAHTGFALSDHEAVSTDYKQKMVVRHQIGTDRAIEAVYRYLWKPISESN